LAARIQEIKDINVVEEINEIDKSSQ